MDVRLRRWAFRLALFLCGVVSLRLSNTFSLLGVLNPSNNNSWNLFRISWAGIGGLGTATALLPSSWVDWACKIGPEARNLAAVPPKLLIGFAASSYLLTAALYLAPPGLRLRPQVVYLLCPACTLTATVDPSFFAVVLLLAPLDAAFYGCLGAVLGYFLLVVRNRIWRN